ncbi:MAG: shikimate dehydrogenase [Defluviitaleaceae bacterium]|nr:shikimate dehydrogenase [Defluviitaleaceae bacterium]
MEISGKTRVLGLLGHPVAHSLSPFIHNMLAQRLNDDVVYAAFDVAPQHLEKAIQGAHALGVAGFNVTHPHKTAAAALAIRLHESARRANAVNTLKYTPDGYLGYNTDIIGIQRAFAHQNIVVAGQTIVLVGAGGAGRAATIAVAEMGCKKLVIANRTRDNAQKLADMLKRDYGTEAEICDISMVKHKECDVFIRSVPQNIAHQPRQYDIIFDMNYFPQKTKSGLLMLIYQAVAAYEIFHDTTVPQDIVDELIASLI